MSEQRTPYWGRFAALAAGSLGLLFLFVFGFLPQRFLLELDFNESGYAFPALLPGLPILPIPVPDIVTRPTPRGPAERFWATYLPLAKGGEYEAAAEVLHAYLKAHPADGAAWLEGARTLWRLRRFEKADAAYARALELDADLDVKLERARMYVDWGRLDEAIALFEELAAITPDDRAGPPFGARSRTGFPPGPRQVGGGAPSSAAVIPSKDGARSTNARKPWLPVRSSAIGKAISCSSAPSAATCSHCVRGNPASPLPLP